MKIIHLGFTLTSLLASLTASANAQIFTLADTTDLALSHTSADLAAAPPTAGSANVGNGVFSWGSLGSDTTANTAEFSSGVFTSSDWGGDGTFTSNALDVSSLSSVSISASFDGLFNTGTEFSNFFYQLDGGSIVEFGMGLEDITYTAELVTQTVDVSAANSLVVGFTFNHNGSSDFFDVNSLTVVPEPSRFALLAGCCGLVSVMLRRRRA